MLALLIDVRDSFFMLKIGLSTRSWINVSESWAPPSPIFSTKNTTVVTDDSFHSSQRFLIKESSIIFVLQRISPTTFFPSLGLFTIAYLRNRDAVLFTLPSHSSTSHLDNIENAP